MTGPLIRKYNSKLLHSQFLSVKAKGRNSLLEITRGCCGINSQNLRDSYLSFWARSESFSEDDIVRELKPGGNLLRMWTVRSTVHTFPVKDYYINVFGSPRDRVLESHDRYARQLGLPDRERRISRLYEPLLGQIGDEAVTTGFINEFVSRKLIDLGLKGYRSLRRGWTDIERYGPAWEGIMEMVYLGLIASAGRNGAENLWMSSSRRIGFKVGEPDAEECRAKLIRNYIDRYGPVTVKDMAYWSGHRMKEINSAIEFLGDDVNVTEGPVGKMPYYSLDDGAGTDREIPEVILLPRFDSLIMGHHDKSRFLEPSRIEHVSSGAGIIEPTFLIDGFVAGTWRKKVTGKKVRFRINQFRKLDRKKKNAVTESFRRMGEFLASDSSVEFRSLG